MQVLNKIKVRMLLTNSAILFGVILIIVLVVYFSMNMNIIVNTDNELINNSVQLRRFLPVIEGKTAEPGLADEFSSFRQLLDNTSTNCLVWDKDYKLVYELSSSIQVKGLDSIARLIFCADTKAARQAFEYKEIYYIYNLGNYRILCTAMANEDGELRTTQLVSNMDAKNDFSRRLLQTLTITGVAGVLASFLIGYFMTSRAIIPIEENISRQKEFVAHASHELRTPITIVRTNLDVALSSRDETVESQSQWLESAYKETERMEKLVEDLLRLAKSDIRQEEASKRRIDLLDLVSNSVDRMKEVAAKKEILFEQTIIGASPLHALGDQGRLEELMAIILDNAVLYSPKGSAIFVSTEKSKSRNAAVIKVRDHGIGLEPGEEEKIFERFYRADKARSRREGGTGLGLSIAKWIVESHGGFISAEGNRGEGTTITVELPLESAGVQ
ncbi:MAG: HAMP domain-containing histidine kinase [Eubacteriaceae bacterium]|jgi:signal transduction histidine kinase|nr:HAMP domain-containing histidine kinase [Eubacteriaceae bacterium]